MSQKQSPITFLPTGEVELTKVPVSEAGETTQRKTLTLREPNWKQLKGLRQSLETLQTRQFELSKELGLLNEAQDLFPAGDAETPAGEDVDQIERVARLFGLNSKSQELRDIIADEVVAWYWSAIGQLVENPPTADIDNSPGYFSNLDGAAAIITHWEEDPFDSGLSSNSQETETQPTQS